MGRSPRPREIRASGGTSETWFCPTPAPYCQNVFDRLYPYNVPQNHFIPRSVSPCQRVDARNLWDSGSVPIGSVAAMGQQRPRSADTTRYRASSAEGSAAARKLSAGSRGGGGQFSESPRMVSQTKLSQKATPREEFGFVSWRNAAGPQTSSRSPSGDKGLVALRFQARMEQEREQQNYRLQCAQKQRIEEEMKECSFRPAINDPTTSRASRDSSRPRSHGRSQHHAPVESTFKASAALASSDYGSKFRETSLDPAQPGMFTPFSTSRKDKNVAVPYYERMAELESSVEQMLREWRAEHSTTRASAPGVSLDDRARVSAPKVMSPLGVFSSAAKQPPGNLASMSPLEPMMLRGAEARDPRTNHSTRPDVRTLFY